MSPSIIHNSFYFMYYDEQKNKQWKTGDADWILPLLEAFMDFVLIGSFSLTIGFYYYCPYHFKTNFIFIGPDVTKSN